MNSGALMELSSVDTAALMPGCVGKDPEISAALGATDRFWRELAAAIPTLGVLATIQQQPDEVLEKLAWQFHVDYWESSWSLATKRVVIIDSIRLHRIAGTRGAVEDVIARIWGDGALVYEWWEYGGEPGTFTVLLTNEQTQGAVTDFVRSIRKVKRATDHLTISIVNDLGTATVRAAAVYHEWVNYEL
jgi:phage tail P2-like protein